MTKRSTSFDPVKHEYRIGGRVVPSVTQVLRDLIPGWSASEWYLNRGTAVHACAAMIADGVVFENDPQIDGQVAACRKWFADVKPEVVAVERQVYSDAYQYAGTLDLQANIGGMDVLIDWKGSLTPATKHQLAAYSMCIHDEQVKKGMGVELRDDGTYKCSELYDLTKAGREWLALLSAYRIRRACGVKETEEEAGE